MLKDDQTSLEVVVSGKIEGSDKLCQTTLYVAAPFQNPNIEINQTEMTATCSTNGGYPEPELKWSGDGGTKLEPQKTTMTREADLTYNISSRVNVTGLQKVTCTVYNPTSNQTLTATKDVSPIKSPDEEPESYTSLAV
ncbi:T-lymphocyte activation antigen CD80-like, partial [Morone saxatilis]|uniref:T-lymphocyte activation antigen CD80-like n=1 Tax=Morone saxatilis TaxID=34816 RepID=UPI0015E24DBC